MKAKGFLLAILFLAGVYFIPWSRVNWGKIEFLPAGTITVIGEAKEDVATQIARFSAGVTATGDTKEAVTNEVNQKIGEVIAKVKDFGIPEKDIQTQNISVYETPEVEILIYPPRPQQAHWTANNSVSIVLRDVNRVSQLADLLNASGANQVSGPSFSVDDTQEAQVALMGKAIASAREKAEKIAQAAGRKLGKVITVNEGGVSSPIYPMMERATSDVSTPVEPGAETVYKSVTVVFELK